MELIGKQIAIETILGQPPELHYPSWYAAQIEKLPPAPPEYLAEQAGILVTDADAISRQAAIDVIDSFNVFESRSDQIKLEQMIGELPPARPEPSQVAKDIERIVGNGEDMRVIAQPEIIRCKDCKWKQGAECVRFADVRPFPSDFCSRAERKTDE